MSKEINVSEQVLRKIMTALCTRLESGCTYEQVWTVVARVFYNRKQLCGECTEKQSHFHDATDWSDPEELKTLHTFWKTIETNEITSFVVDTHKYINDNKQNLINRFMEQTIRALAFLKTIVTDETRDIFTVLLADTTLESSFTFNCALICTCMDMDNTEEPEIIWFETFLRNYIQDTTPPVSDSDESEQDDNESDENDNESDENANEYDENANESDEEDEEDDDESNDVQDIKDEPLRK